MRLKELREEKGITQKNLADSLGLKRTRITSYETGANHPEYAVLLQLADYFHVSLDYLTGRTDSPEATLAEEESRILLLLRRLPAEERDAFLRLLETMAKR